MALIHGGLYEPMDATAFWADTGVVEALSRRGIAALTPQRLAEPRSWAEDADHVAVQLRSDVDGGVPVVAGSNGCSTAAHLAIADPGLVERLAFCWPVTVGQEHVAEQRQAEQISRWSGERVASALLSGGALRGLADTDLASLDVPVAVMASDPENAVHRHETAETLLRLCAGSVALPPMPEPPTTGFDPASFAAAIERWLARND